MKKQLLTLTISALLATAQSAMAFEQINSENDYEPAIKNGWVSQANINAASFNVSFKNNSDYETRFSGGGENDTGVITFTFPPSKDVNGRSDPFSINYDSNH